MPKPLPSSPKSQCVTVYMEIGASGVTAAYFAAPVTGRVHSWSAVTELNTDDNVTFTLAVNGVAVQPSSGVVVAANNQQLVRSVNATGLLANGLPANVVQDQSVVLVQALNAGALATNAFVNVYFRSAQ